MVSWPVEWEPLEEAKWKPIELSQPRERVNQKQYFIPWGSAEISATTKDLKDAGLVILSHSVQLAYLSCVEDRRILENYTGLLEILTRWWLQVQLLYQMYFHYLSKLTYPLVNAMQLLILQMLFVCPC